MKRGFTLLELMIVIIIIGVLATVGIVQYQTAIEKSRSAEAKAVAGQLRSICAALYMGNPASGSAQCSAASLGLGTAAGTIQSTAACAQGSHWFWYAVDTATATSLTVTATRCLAGGKTPVATGVAGTVVLTSNYNSGADTWTSTGVY